MELHRRGSTRDPEKAQKQSEALGSSQNARQKTCFNLVVCSATNPQKDGPIFSDFMGFCMGLHELGAGGDFFSCFPIQEHFLWLRNEHSPPIDVIKFGKMGPNKDKPLYTYARHTYMNRNYWWKQVGKHELLGKVKDWIAMKKEQTEPGDVVNIIFEGHGNSKDGYVIGDRHLHPAVFQMLISGFRDGVQVNAISGACYSGQFADRIKASNQRYRYVAAASPSDDVAYVTTRSVSNRVRNSRFSQAFVQSLAKISLPGIRRRCITWRIQDHEAFMVEQLTRNLTPTGRAIPPQFYASEPVTGLTALEDLVCRDKIDINYDPREASRRRRIEWPTQDDHIRHCLTEGDSSPTRTVSDESRAVIDEELSKCDTRAGCSTDLWVFDELYVRSPDWRGVLRNLYWRARRQSATWDVFELLVNRGFIDPSCLTIPVKLGTLTRDAGMVSRLLDCFEFPALDSLDFVQGTIPLQPPEWNMDTAWLATMIVRGGAELDKLFDTILASGFLGEFNAKDLDMGQNIYPTRTISHDPRAGEGVLNEDGAVPPGENIFGFWLPHGLSSNERVLAVQLRERHFRRFNQIERAFRREEGIPQEKLWLESEQAQFFEKNTTLLPGAQNDIPEIHIVCDNPRAI